MMRRWVAPLMAVLGLVGMMAAGGSAQAASSSIVSELLVLLPQGKHLAVYEQVVLAHPGATTTLGVLAGHGAVKGVNVQLGPAGLHHVVLDGATGTVAVEYAVPWNGTSQYLALRQYLPVSALVVMVPPADTLPSVLNAAFQVLPSRAIPGLPASPKFHVYETTSVHANTVTAFSVAAGGTTVAGRQGFPAVGSAVLLALALVVLAALYLVVNWSPLRDATHARAQREDLLERLAGIEALYRRGELEDVVYRVEREALLGELARVWTPESV